MNKTFKILEIIWLIVCCIGLFMCIYSLIIKDNNRAIYFFGFFVISGIMYFVRKRQRINFERAQKQKEQK
jgi:uncharacterized membrane protein YfcA